MSSFGYRACLDSNVQPIEGLRLPLGHPGRTVVGRGERGMRGREVQSVRPAAEEGEDRLTSGGPVGSSRDYRKGPVTLRRGLVPHSTTDQRLLDSRGSTDWGATETRRGLPMQAACAG